MPTLKTVSAASHVLLAEVPDPVPAPIRPLVRVRASSLNCGRFSTCRRWPRERWLAGDVAGVVERAAGGRQRAPAGTRVVGLVRTGAWAQLAAVPVSLEVPAPKADDDPDDAGPGQ